MKPIIDPDAQRELADSSGPDSPANAETNGSWVRTGLVLAGFALVATIGFGSSAGWFDFITTATVKDTPGEDIVDTLKQVKPESGESTPSVESVPALATDVEQPLPLGPVIPEQAAALTEECRRVAMHLVTQMPNSVEANEMLARFEFEFGSTDEARKIWEKILAVSPGFSYALRGLGDVATMDGDLDGAVRYFRRGVMAEPNNLSRQVTLGAAMLQAAQLEEARQVLEGVVKQQPSHAEAHRELATVLMQLEEYEAAREHFELVLETAPDDVAVHFGLASALALLGEEDLAAQHRAEHKRLESLAKSSRESGRREYDDVEAMRIDIGRLYVDFARVYLAGGHARSAELLLLRAGRMDPTNVDCRQALAFLSAQQGKTFEAIRWLREISGLQPAEFAYVREIARLYLEAGQADVAESALKQFVETQPPNLEAVRSLAQFYLEIQSDVPSALEYRRRAVEIEPSAEDYAALASVYELDKQYENAMESLRQAIQLDPDNAALPQSLALLKEKSNQSVESAVELP